LSPKLHSQIANSKIVAKRLQSALPKETKRPIYKRKY